MPEAPGSFVLWLPVGFRPRETDREGGRRKRVGGVVPSPGSFRASPPWAWQWLSSSADAVALSRLCSRKLLFSAGSGKLCHLLHS